MTQRIAQIALVVRDYDEAIRFYCETLGFELREDTDLGGGKRWVRVGPAPGTSPAPENNQNGTEFLLARAVTPEQESRIGNQTGGRVFIFLETDDFDRDYNLYKSRGVEFIRGPVEETFGKVAVFLDLYGNKFDLIERRAL